MIDFVDILRIGNAVGAVVVLVAMSIRWRHWLGLQPGRKLLRLALAIAILTALVGSVQSVLLDSGSGPSTYLVTTTLLATTAGLIADDPPSKERP